MTETVLTQAVLPTVSQAYRNGLDRAQRFMVNARTSSAPAPPRDDAEMWQLQPHGTEQLVAVLRGDGEGARWVKVSS